MRKLTKEFIISLLTVLLGILAIGLFIHSGASIWFYAAIIIAIIVGFYNAWLISRPETADDRKGAPVPRKFKRKRR